MLKSSWKASMTIKEILWIPDGARDSTQGCPHAMHELDHLGYLLSLESFFYGPLVLTFPASSLGPVL